MCVKKSVFSAFTNLQYTMLELAGLFVLGFLAQWLAWRIKVPAILPLIVVGLLVGLFLSYGMKVGKNLLMEIASSKAKCYLML